MSKLPGIPPKYERLASWIVQSIIKAAKKALRDIGKLGCDKADKAIKALKAKGVPVPDMKGWSCDQKLAFIASLGPDGMALLLGTAATAKLAKDAAEEAKRLGRKLGF